MSEAQEPQPPLCEWPEEDCEYIAQFLYEDGLVRLLLCSSHYRERMRLHR